MRTTSTLLLALLTVLPWSAAFALQDGEIDPAFGNLEGYRHTDSTAAGGSTQDRGLFAQRLADGRVLVVGQGAQPAAQRAQVFLFGPDGVGLVGLITFAQEFVLIDGIAPAQRGIGVDASERLLIGGTTADPVDELYDPVVVRALPPDYTPDPTYGVGGEARPFAYNEDAALLALAVAPDGSSVACGTMLVAGTARYGFCVRLDPNGALDPSFGAAGRLMFMPPNLTQTTIDAVAFDAQGRLLLAGHVLHSARVGTYGFVARADAGGVLDPTFCASECGGASVLQSGPGYRIEATALSSVGQRRCFDVAERADGQIAVARFPGEYFGGRVDYARYRDDGQLAGLVSFRPGDGVRGCGKLVPQADLTAVIALTWIEAGLQYGGVTRLLPSSTAEQMLDPDFSAAGLRLRAPLPGALVSDSNECNHVLVETTGILCTGPTRTSDTPLNLDLMLVRLRNGVPLQLFADGFDDVVPPTLR